MKYYLFFFKKNSFILVLLLALMPFTSFADYFTHSSFKTTGGAKQISSENEISSFIEHLYDYGESIYEKKGLSIGVPNRALGSNVGSADDPLSDSDGDGIDDIDDIDDDNDGILDVLEMVCDPLPSWNIKVYDYNPISSVDCSGDNLGQLTEYASGTMTYGNGLSINWVNAQKQDQLLSSLNASGGNITGSNPPDNTFAVYHTHTFNEWDYGLYKIIPGTIYDGKKIYKVSTDGTDTLLYCSSIWSSNAPQLEVFFEPGSELKIITYETSITNTRTVVDIAHSYLCNNMVDVDLDGDNIPNRLDLDSDGDGCSDSYEAGAIASETPDHRFDTSGGGDANGDGLADVVDDGINGGTASDGIADYKYLPYAYLSTLNLCTDTDSDGKGDLRDIDDDNDGILDATESPDCFFTAGDFESGNRSGFVTVSTGLDMNVDRNAPQKLVDRDAATSSYAVNFINNQTNEGSDVYTFQFETPVELANIYVQYVNGNSHFINGAVVKLQGSNNGDNWIDLNTGSTYNQTNASGAVLNQGTMRYHVFSVSQNSSLYHYYRIRGVSGAIWNGGISNEVYFEVHSGFHASRNPKGSCTTDTDNDGMLNHRDLDSDGDGCSDSYEAGAIASETPDHRFDTSGGGDANGDGLADVVDDGINGGTASDGIADYKHLPYAYSSTLNLCTDTDSDGKGDLRDIDDDNDGILDVLEMVCDPLPSWNVKVYDYNYTGTVDCSGDNLGQLTEYASGTMTYGNGLSINWVNAQKQDQLLSSLNASGGNITGSNPPDITFAVYHTHRFNEWDYGLYKIIPGTIYDGKKIYKVSTDGTETLLYCTSIWNIAAPELEVFFEPGTELKIITYEIGKVDTRTVVDIAHSYLCNNMVDVDLDGDNIPNRLDLDSDGDGCSDSYEAGAIASETPSHQFNTSGGGDANGDGLADAIDDGSNGGTASDGIPDYDYTPYAYSGDLNLCADTDNDGITDIKDLDDDNDGVLDTDECTPNEDHTKEYKKIFDFNDPSDVAEWTNFGLIEAPKHSTDADGDVTNEPVWTNSRIPSPDNSEFMTAKDVGGGRGSLQYPHKITSATAVNLPGGINRLSFDMFNAATSGINIDLDIKVELFTENGTITLTGDYTAEQKNTLNGEHNANGTVWARAPGWITMELDLSSHAFTELKGIRFHVEHITGSVSTEVMALDNIAFYKQHDAPICNSDVDNDGIPNHLDLDTDGDGCTDAEEAGTYNKAGVVMEAGEVKNGSGGFVSSQESNPNAVVGGPYGGNGFADVLQKASPDTNQYAYTYTYGNATDSTVHNCCPVVSDNTIGSDQMVCPPDTASTLTGSVPTLLPTGATVLYQWMSSTSGATSGFSNVPGRTSKDFVFSGPLAQTTHYRRVAYTAACSKYNDTTAAVTVTVKPLPTITDVVAPICLDDDRYITAFETSWQDSSTVTALPLGLTPTRILRDSTIDDESWYLEVPTGTDFTVTVSEDGCSVEKSYTAPDTCGGDGPYALGLEDFSAERVEGGIRLSWRVAEPELLDRAVLERGGVPTGLESIGVFLDPESDGYYNYVDRDPVVGDNFYRLSLYGADGTVEASEGLRVVYDPLDKYAYLLQNPVEDGMAVLRTNTDAPVVSVYDLSGRAVPFSSERQIGGDLHLFFGGMSDRVLIVRLRAGHLLRSFRVVLR